MLKLVVIPDVHGIDDWRTPVANALLQSNTHIVFLGDYVDSYVQNTWTILENLKEIIDAKKNNPDRITLLIGNHDAAYIYGRTGITGFNFPMWPLYRDVFNANSKYFQLAWGYQGKERYTLLTHAGLTKWFYGALIREINYEDSRMGLIFEGVDYTKLPLHEFLNYFDNEHELMWKIGTRRYGHSPVGSILWADRYDLIMDNYEGIDQIVGHTNIHAVEVKNMFGDKLYFVDNHDENNGKLSAFSIELE